MKITQKMLNAAMKKAVSLEIIPKHSDQESYLKYWEGMKKVLEVAANESRKESKRGASMKHKIHDREICTEVQVEAPGVIEAMAEYLPWPSLQLDIDYSPTNGMARVEDKATQFLYDVEW